MWEVRRLRFAEATALSGREVADRPWRENVQGLASYSASRAAAARGYRYNAASEEEYLCVVALTAGRNGTVECGVG